MKAATLILSILFLLALQSGARSIEIRQDPPAAEGDSFARLVESVRSLRLGEGDLVIGNYLSRDQVEHARANRLDDAYPGTIKFPSGDIVVVADDETHLILALYQQQENASADDFKLMVGGLMARFGEPTTTAHNKLIYWAFGGSGKIDEAAYLASKSTGELDILATVKFNSSLTLSPDLDKESEPERGTIYYIITSDRLLQKYMTSP